MSGRKLKLSFSSSLVLSRIFLFTVRNESESSVSSRKRNALSINIALLLNLLVTSLVLCVINQVERMSVLIN